jgi:hypothetical protein
MKRVTQTRYIGMVRLICVGRRFLNLPGRLAKVGDDRGDRGDNGEAEPEPDGFQFISRLVFPILN